MASLLIDDFKKGAYNKSLDPGENNLDIQSDSTGSIRGGKRWTYLSVTSDISQKPAATLDIGNGRLILNTGVNVFHRLEVGYGFDNALPWKWFPLGLELSPNYSRFVIDFEFIDNVQGDNFIIQVVTAPGSLPELPGGGMSQAGVSSLPVGKKSFSFDELSFDKFVGAGPVPGAAANFKRIDMIYFIFQSGSERGASDFAITSIYCV